MNLSHATSLPTAGSPRIKVMVTDDSVVVRGLVSRWLEEAGFEIVASVANGLMAIEALGRAEPDIVVLDIDMPELDGISTLPRLLAKRPDLSVVVISTLTQRNADISLKCLSLGAVDYLPKPESNRGVTISTSFRAELVAKLQALGRRHRRKAAAEPSHRSPAPPSPRPLFAALPLMTLPRCLLIGASTGGPRAIGEVLSRVGPVLRSVPTLIVQHMPPIFTAVFAEHLSVQLGLPVREAAHGEILGPGQIVVAPGGRHMGLSRVDGRAAVRLDDGPPVNFCRPAVDVLFRDAATVFGASALAVVLTGMGSDGTHGARALAGAGAAVLAQDEATSTVWGMPGSIARAGLAHDVLPLEAMAPAIQALLSGGAS
jgi:two-component system, chemotaxis family, protein-glutamate methylesterase/glutaminase